MELLPSFLLKMEPDNISIPVFSMKAKAYLQKLEDALEKAELESSDSNVAKHLSYNWSNDTKQVALLLRDCLLNLLKLKYYEEDGLRDKSTVDQYKSEVAKVVNDATRHLDDKYKELVSSEAKADPKWKHEFNPAPTILAQLKTIEDQIKRITRSDYKLDDISSSLENFTSDYFDTMQSRVHRSENLNLKVTDLLKDLEASDLTLTKLEMQKLVNRVEELATEIDNQTEFNPYSSIIIEDIDKIVLPVQSEGGRLQFKTIDIISEISSWISFNLTGPLKAIDSVFHNYRERVSIALSQMANRLRAKSDPDSDEDVVFQPKELSKSISKLDEDYKTSIKPKVNDALIKLQSEINATLKISKMFDEELTFLPVSKLSQFSGGLTFQETLLRRYNFKNIVEGFHSLTNNFFTQDGGVKSPIAASFTENVLKFDPDNDSHALFMRKGFLGSSFFVNRPQIENEINSHFKLWESGFGGGLLVSGNHGSGRSTMLDVITHHYNDNYNFYNIINGGTLDINGRKIVIDGNLIDTINEVIKYKGERPCIIKIDGLKDFVCSLEELYVIMTDLTQLINKYSHKIYFAISIHESLLERVKHFFPLDSTFTKIVNVSFMDKASIVEAIVMRAFAVADHDEVTYNSDKIREKANKVAAKCSGNIGLGMLLWCMSDDSEEVKVPSEEFRRKIIKHKDLLNYMLLGPPMSITHLKKYFDDVEYKNLKFDVEHLVHQKILVRHPGGLLSLDPFIQYFVCQVLNNK